MKKNFLIYILILLVSASIFIVLNNSVNKKTSDNKSDKKSKFTLFKHKIKKDFVKVIDVYGPISFTGEKNLFGIRYGADYIIQQIKSAEQNSKNIGLLLRINSPGGTVAASQEIYNAILNYKNKTNRKVITSMADIAASGGYYIATASDTIFANSGTLTGSIGVIINGFNLEQLLKKIGVQSQTFKSDKHKDILSPYRPVSDTETKILQNTVINVYNQFINAVMVNRQNRIINDTSTLFDGRIFTGEPVLPETFHRYSRESL